MKKGLFCLAVVAGWLPALVGSPGFLLKPEAAQLLIYLDPAKPLDERVDDLIGRLTLAEKMSLLGTTAPAIERLKIPAMNGWNQSLHGIVWTEPTTMFPVPISMGDVEHDAGARRRRGNRRRGTSHQ